MSSIFDVTQLEQSDESKDQPEPEICPCTIVTNFRCPARIESRLLKRCVGSENYRRCGNFSGWFWFKVAQSKAKDIEVPE